MSAGKSTALDELKTHLRGVKIVLRSKTPHFAIRGLMHKAALKAGEDPDRLSFLHAVRVIRRKLPRFAAIPPLGRGVPFITPCSTKSCRNALSAVATEAILAASNAR
jgi:hypothetical protein